MVEDQNHNSGEEYNSIIWSQASGPTGGTIYCMAEDINGKLFCGGNSGLYASDNSGNSWERIFYSNDNITDIIFSNEGDICTSSSKQIFISKDGGKTWEKIWEVPSPNGYIECIVYHPSGYILVATYGDGLIKLMTISGQSEKLNTNLSYFSTIHIDPQKSDIIIAGGGSGTERSTDGGYSWQRVSSLSGPILCILAVSDSILFAGSYVVDVPSNTTLIFRSNDNGLTWQRWGGYKNGLVAASVTDLIKTPDGKIYAGTAYGDAGKDEFGIFISYDQGNNWSRTSAPPLPVSDLLYTNKNIFFASTYNGGVIRSSDGDDWGNSNLGLHNSKVNDLLLLSDNNIYVGTDRGLYRSQGNFSEWKITISDRIQKLYTIDEEIILVSAWYKLFRSENYGETWNRLEDTLYMGLVRCFAEDNNGVIYCGTDRGVFISHDKGLNFQSSGLYEINLFTSSLIYTQDGHLFAATSSGSGENNLFKSSDGGNIWESVYSFEAGTRITSLAAYGNIFLYAGTYKNGIYRSIDGGKKWENIGLAEFMIRTILCYSENIIVVGTDNGVYVSNDKGKNWYAESIGLSSPDISVIKIDNSNHLVAGTYGNSFFYSQNSLTEN